MTVYENKGKPPRDKSVKLGIRWANGELARHEYTAGQLTWDIRGWPHDIGWFWKSGDGEASTSTWDAKSGGY